MCEKKLSFCVCVRRLYISVCVCACVCESQNNVCFLCLERNEWTNKGKQNKEVIPPLPSSATPQQRHKKWLNIFTVSYSISALSSQLGQSHFIPCQLDITTSNEITDSFYLVLQDCFSPLDIASVLGTMASHHLFQNYLSALIRCRVIHSVVQFDKGWGPVSSQKAEVLATGIDSTYITISDRNPTLQNQLL